MEISVISAALTSIKSAVDLAKLIKDSSSSLEAAEMNLKLAELIGAPADAKIEIANIREVVIEKDEEIKKLKQKLVMNGKVIWQEPYYFVEEENGDKDGPFCQKCYDAGKTLIRLQSPTKNGYWECKECKSYFQDENYKANAGVVSTRRRRAIDFDKY